MGKQLKHAQGVLPTETFLSLQCPVLCLPATSRNESETQHILRNASSRVQRTTAGVYSVLYLSKLSSSRVISMNVFSFLSILAATSFTFGLLCLPVKDRKILNTTNQKHTHFFNAGKILVKTQPPISPTLVHH